MKSPNKQALSSWLDSIGAINPIIMKHFGWTCLLLPDAPGLEEANQFVQAARMRGSKTLKVVILMDGKEIARESIPSQPSAVADLWGKWPVEDVLVTDSSHGFIFWIDCSHEYTLVAGPEEFVFRAANSDYSTAHESYSKWFDRPSFTEEEYREAMNRWSIYCDND